MTAGWGFEEWRGWQRAGEITYECRLLPAQIEEWYQGQGFLLPRCPSEKAQRGSRLAMVLMVLVRTSEGFKWVVAKWWETIAKIAPSRRT